MTHAKLIDDLGGSGYLAGRLGEKPGTVSNWKKQNISWRVRHKVAKIARRKKVALPDNFLG